VRPTTTHRTYCVHPIVDGEQLLERADAVHVTEAAPPVRLQEDRQAERAHHRLPAEREHEVREAAGGDVLAVRLRRQHVRLRHGDAEARGERGAEGLVVGDAPEGVVDDARAGERARLEHRLIAGDLVADAVDDHVVRRRVVDGRQIELAVLGDDARVATRHLGDEPVREAPLASHEDSDSLHGGRG
jgi:hypothetical protein